MTDYTELLARLERNIDTGRRAMGGGCLGLDSDGKPTFSTWGGERIMALANPDGPEAAAAIRALLAENERLRAPSKDVLAVMNPQSGGVAASSPHAQSWG